MTALNKPIYDEDSDRTLIGCYLRCPYSATRQS